MNYERDISSPAIVSSDVEALNKHNREKRQLLRLRHLEEEVARLKLQVELLLQRDCNNGINASPD